MQGKDSRQQQHQHRKSLLRNLNRQKPSLSWLHHKVCTRQWLEASDFVARFCTLHKSEKHQDMWELHEFRVQFVLRAIPSLASWCVFWPAQHAKKCDTNHIPRATAYFGTISWIHCQWRIHQVFNVARLSQPRRVLQIPIVQVAGREETQQRSRVLTLTDRSQQEVKLRLSFRWSIIGKAPHSDF